MIYLSQKDPAVDIRGTVSRPGLYTFVLHYFQPENPEFELEASIQNGQFHNGIASLVHCPSRTGCRTVLRQRETNSSLFQIDEGFMITLKQSDGKGVWVDYILAVPADHYDPAILELKTQEKTSNLLAECVQNSYFIDPDEASGNKLITKLINFFLNQM